MSHTQAPLRNWISGMSRRAEGYSLLGTGERMLTPRSNDARTLTPRNAAGRKSVSRASFVDDEDMPDFAEIIRKAAVLDAEALDALRRAWNGAPLVLKAAEPLDGNIYKYFTFRAFMEKKEDEDDETLFTPPEGTLERAVIIVGLVLIMVIQVFAPLAVLSNNIAYLVYNSFNPFNTPYGTDPEVNKCWAYWPSQWLVVILSQAFLFCFILNAYKGCCSSKEQMEHILRLALLLEHSGQRVCKCVLVLDAFINSYVAVFLSISMFAVLFKEPDAQSVVLDALGLAFVLNLDEVASDLGFLGDVWNSARVGRFYACLCKYNEKLLLDKEMEEEENVVDKIAEVADTIAEVAEVAKGQKDVADFDFRKASKHLNRVPRCFYSTAQCCLLVMLPIAILSPFWLMHSAVVDPDLVLWLNGTLTLQTLSDKFILQAEAATEAAAANMTE